MDRVAIDFGFIKIYWYSIFILSGIITAVYTIHKECRKENISDEFLWDLVFKVVLLGILGARVYYVLFNLDYYLANPTEIIEIWHGGLAIHGGLIVGLIVTYFECKKKNIKLLKMLDIIVVGVIIAQAIGRWGNFFNAEAYGNITTLSHLKAQFIPDFIIKGMYINGFYRQPTFLYESIFCFLGFIIMIVLRKVKKLKVGTLTSFYLIWYGLVRVVIESMRSDSLMIFNIKMAQIVSLLFIISGIIVLIKTNKE